MLAVANPASMWKECANVSAQSSHRCIVAYFLTCVLDQSDTHLRSAAKTLRILEEQQLSADRAGERLHALKLMAIARRARSDLWRYGHEVTDYDDLI